jgi:hypothetical protein
MKPTIKTCLLATAFTAVTLVGSVDHVEAGNNSWGWAKPLSQKPGSLLYTLNRKNRRTTTSRNTTSYRSHRLQTYTQPIMTAPAAESRIIVQSPAVMIDSTPTTQVPKQPVLRHRVIHSQPRVVQPPVKTPSVLDGWLVP